MQTISSDKNKLQAYCELGRLQEQMEKAEEKNDTKTIDAQASARPQLQLRALQKPGGGGVPLLSAVSLPVLSSGLAPYRNRIDFKAFRLC